MADAGTASIKPAWIEPIGIEIDSSPQPQHSVAGENKAQQDAANGYIHNSATHSISALDDMLSKTDFTSTQMASLASGGIRPGEIQLDPNVRPDVWLKDYDLTPNSYRPNQNLLNAVTLNGLSAMTTFNTYVDPLLLDLSGQGVRMTDIRDGVLFDMDNSGTLKRTGWADRETGILVVDNGSGQIKNVSQMFSEYYKGTAGSNGNAGGKKYQHGFAALASEDANGDGVINASDAIWNQLRVWVDSSHDAQVNAGEYKKLAELGISQISVHATDKNEVRDGNRVNASGSFTINGKRQEMLAVDFLGDPVSSTLSKQGAGTKVISRTGDITTTAYASQSQTGEALDANKLGVSNLYGGIGNDTLIAHKAGSWLVGGAGSNTYIGDKGNDVFVISATDDEKNIHGNGGRDTAIIVGKEGVELNMTSAGLTIAEGGSGNDIIRSGGANGIFIKGGSGNSTLIGGGGNDVLVGGSGQNTIIGGSGKSVIYAGPQGDTIYASESGSIIHAGGGNDKIFGGYGDDVIEVGHGNATIDGDGGVNLVTLHGNHGDYQITRTDSGYQAADKVAGRDGTVTLKNIHKLNFADISAVDLQIPNAMPVADTLTQDKHGRTFSRSQPHLISADSILKNDQRLNSKGELRIASAGDATGGTVKLTAQGDILFTPDASYTGLLSFKYGVADAAGNLSASVIDLNTGQQAPMRAVVSLMTAEIPDDPLAVQEWYLSDTNILSVWEDYTGKGIRIGQFEPGGQFATGPEIFDISHPDLVARVDKTWLQSQQDNGTLPDLVSNHATMVAGIMVAARNGIGGVGVAYDATLAGHSLANNGEDLAALGNMVSYDIANNSWGFTHDFALSNLQNGAINTASSLAMNAQYAAANGRGGLGTVIVTAGGNNRAAGGNAQGSLTSNNRFSVEVGSINAQNDLSTLQIGSKPFSSPGASLLVSAPGSNIVSTSHMLETERGSTFGSDYSSMQGTSFATPIVSGIVALMLEANPNLGYRDVQKILALSARKVNDPTTQWHDNHSKNWNGGGMHASHDYGFGEVDARAAVRLAESWMEKNTAANEEVLSASSGHVGKRVSAGDTLTSTVTISDGLRVQHVEIDFDAEVGRLGDVTLKLISPDGTESVLLNRQGKIPAGMPGAGDGDRGSSRAGAFKYTFMTTHDFGERSQGDWTLQVSDAKSGLPVTLNTWSLRLYGSKTTADDTYFYTDEYASLADNAKRKVLDDAVNGTAGGRNTLHAAAVTKDVSVNLMTGAASIGRAALTIKQPGSIQNIVSGDGNDTLVAGKASSLLDGGRGVNTLTGGSGKDYFVIHRRKAGCDVINNFDTSRGEKINLVGFRGKTFADLHLSQQGSNVKIELENGQSIILSNQNTAAINARHFDFHDNFSAPAGYISSDTATEEVKEGLGTVVLNGGSKGVKLTSNAQGQMIFSLNGTVYSHDSAASDVFVVAPQPGAKNYQNALRGFRHGIDKLDLRQLGITDFNQLTIAKNKRGTINGLSQIHGVDVSFAVKGKDDAKINLVYLDSLETSQLDAGDFIFAETPSDLLQIVEPVKIDNVDKPVLVDPLSPTSYQPFIPANDFKPAELKPFKPVIIKPVELETFEPIKINPIEIPRLDIKPVIPVDNPPNQIADSTGSNSITLKKWSEKIAFGNESKIINVEGMNNKVIAGDGHNRINVNGRWAEITLGNGNNVVVGNMDKLTVGHGNNTISATGTFSKVKLGDGNNKVLLSGSMATLEVGKGVTDVKFSGSMGYLTFAASVDPNRLWFQHKEQDLQISVTGSAQRVVLHDWYASTQQRAWQITAGGNNRLMSNNVENLVQAMAAFAPSSSATTLLSEHELQRLQPVLAANWR